MTIQSTDREPDLTVELANWEWLRPHLGRGGLIVVSPELDLVAAGFSIANDDTTSVNAWIDGGLLTKPSPAQVFDWDAEPATSFHILIASPYVLVQPIPARTS